VVRTEWEPEDLIEVWTLLEEDQERLRTKSGANRLGFALLLRFFEVQVSRPRLGGRTRPTSGGHPQSRATFDWIGWQSDAGAEVSGRRRLPQGHLDMVFPVSDAP
jgi:hypothetical protein